MLTRRFRLLPDIDVMLLLLCEDLSAQAEEVEKHHPRLLTEHHLQSVEVHIHICVDLR